MRCVEIITIVLLVSGLAFADVAQNQGQSTDVDQYQWQLNAGIGSSMGGNQSITYYYPEPKVGFVNPYIPYHLHVAPSPQQIVLWNSFGFNPLFLEGEYTMEEVNYPLKSAGKNVLDISKWFVECGNGFEYVTSFNAKYKPTSRILVTGANMTLQDIPEFVKKYKRIGSVNVGARKDLNFSLAFNWALKLAMQGGGDVALLSLSSGMNSLANGISIGPGGSVGFAGGNSSIAASLGLNSSDTKFQGEAGVMLLVFKKNWNFVETRTIGGIRIPEVGGKAGEEIMKTISPPKEETQEIRSSLDKEKASPAEMERFVEQLLNG